ncbi:MAG: hypothetical protein ACI9XZ_002347 [Alphaproteobacteria bacterium]|jgi:hypothetical protein
MKEMIGLRIQFDQSRCARLDALEAQLYVAGEAALLQLPNPAVAQLPTKNFPLLEADQPSWRGTPLCPLSLQSGSPTCEKLAT